MPQPDAFNAGHVQLLREDLRDMVRVLGTWEGCMGRRDEEFPGMEDAFNTARTALESLVDAIREGLRT